MTSSKQSLKDMAMQMEI